jgi:hypothetical protein
MVSTPGASTAGVRDETLVQTIGRAMTVIKSQARGARGGD